MSDDSFPLTLEGVTQRIERLRGEAGKDVAKLATLAQELESYLREAVPEDSFLADYTRKVLEGYGLLARYGIFPPEATGDEDL